MDGSRLRKIGCFVILSFVFSGVTHADEGNVMDLVKVLQKQVQDMQKTIEQQSVKISQLEKRQPQIEMAVAPKEVPPAMATMSDADFEKGIKDNIGKAVPWLKGAKYGGDFRLRYEAFDYYNKNNDAGSTGTANDRSRNRFRYRLRWGFEKDYGDDWKFGFRLASGSTTDQTSTNQTLGNPGYFNFKSFNTEKAYAIYSPNGLKDYGILKGVTIGAGKFDNPFLRYSTAIVWDGDVTPEGAYEQANFQLMSTEEAKLNFYGTLGQFAVNENTTVATDAQLWGMQGALNYSTYAFNADHPTDFTVAASYYIYDNWSQTVTANTASTSYLRTNSLIADNFNVVDIYPEVVFYWNDTPTTLWYDYAVNVDNVGTDDINGSLGNDIHNMDNAWGAGIKIGKIKKTRDWEAFYGYYRIGASAVVAAFNDSDFGGPGQAGFTNRKGHKLGIGYKLTDNITANWTGYLVRPLDPTAIVANSTNESVFRSQLDLVWKF